MLEIDALTLTCSAEEEVSLCVCFDSCSSRSAFLERNAATVWFREPSFSPLSLSVVRSVLTRALDDFRDS